MEHRRDSAVPGKVHLLSAVVHALEYLEWDVLDFEHSTARQVLDIFGQ